VILDSLSHFWAGDGGTLDLVDQIARTKYKNDSHRAWKDAGEIQQRLTDAILRSPLHVIAAMRTKKDYVREEVDGQDEDPCRRHQDGAARRVRLRVRPDRPVRHADGDGDREVAVRRPAAGNDHREARPAFVDGLIRFLGEGEALASAEVAARRSTS
jgi:hypothetical protein